MPFVSWLVMLERWILTPPPAPVAEPPFAGTEAARLFLSRPLAAGAAAAGSGGDVAGAAAAGAAGTAASGAAGAAAAGAAGAAAAGAAGAAATGAAEVAVLCDGGGSLACYANTKGADDRALELYITAQQSSTTSRGANERREHTSWVGEDTASD